MESGNPHGKGLAIGLSRQVSLCIVQRLLEPVVNEDGSLKPEAIRALFTSSNTAIAAFARAQGVSDSYVQAVISRRRPDRRIQDAIAALFGMDSNLMWGREAQAS